MSAEDILQTVVGKVGEFYEWLADRLNDDAARAEVLIDLGLPPNIPVGQPFPQHRIKGINEYRKTISVETEVSTAHAQDLGKVLGLSSSKAAKLVLPEKNLADIRAYRDAKDPSFDDFKKALGDIKEVFTALTNFVKALDVEGIHNIPELVHRLIDILMVDYLRLHFVPYGPLIYWLAQPLGFLEEPLTATIPHVVWNRFVTIFRKRGWLLDDEEQARTFSDSVFIPLAAALVILEFKGLTSSTSREDDGDLSTLAIEPLYGWEPAPGSATPLLDKMSERTLSLRFNWKERSPTDPKKAIDKNGTLTLLFIPKIHGGPGLLVSFEFGASINVPINKDWRFKVTPSVTSGDLFFHLDEFSKSSAGGPGQPSIKFGFEGGSAETPLYRLGKEDGSHLQFGKFEAEFELSPAVAGVRALSRESEVVLNLDKSGNGFLSQILPGEKQIPLNLGLGWSTERGFFLEGGKGNVIKQTNSPPPLPSSPRLASLSRAPRSREVDAAAAADLNRITPVGKTFGPARIQFLSLGLKPQSEDGNAKLTLAATLAADVRLGPLTASFDKMGFALTVDFVKPDANLGLFDLDFGFQPPKAIGLDIDGKVVHGGGFLDLDREHSQYAGALHLEIEGFAALSALGLLNTNIPGGGFSLLVIITADGFKPIPIGFGFMLIGIGGLLGIHRTVNEDAVQAGVRANTLNAVLAPKDLVRNAPQYLSVIRNFFPVARDHYLFGLVAQITWGTPPLITINLALILELGVRTRFLILGQVLAVLPKKDLALVRLQMNIFGGVDFDQKRAFLDAVLFDSRLVDRFVITGEMRMRLSWGNQPFFALSVGGLHPAFVPPPGLERMQRAAIVFADSENLKIRCDSYFAITSNTVQFGAHAELFAKKSKFSISGQAGYDVLIQFDPFHFIASLSASLQLKAGPTNLFKVSFAGELSGPRPLNVKGKATFEIWWIDFTVSFNATLVSGEKPPLPAPVDVGALLRTALADAAAWNAVMPGTSERLVSLREGQAGAVRIHPLSTLTVKQSVVPLNTPISRFGNTRPQGGTQEFRIQQIKVGNAMLTPLAGDLVRDHFAPAQFRDLTDDQKLSSPSFELLPAGVSVGSNAVDCGTPVPAAADFEDIVIPSPPEEPRTTTTVRFDLAKLFSEWSAVGMSDTSRLGAIRYRAAAISSLAEPKTFTVKSKVDLSNFEGTTTFATHLEAEDALKKMNKEDAANFQVVAKR
ncbi:MAG: hypothetical protein P0120_02880 [Nitrospira sp.]|nr:hypothetical protein [Nitrospira sp.]